MQTPNTSLTIHGWQRLRERTQFEDIDVQGLITDGLSVNVGTENGTKRIHWLLWSEGDKEWFVVVRDENTGEVVTVLTLQFHANLAWPVTDLHMGLARKLAHSRTKPSLEAADLPILKTYLPRLRLAVTVVFRPLTISSRIIYDST